MQARVRELVVDRLQWDGRGRALDIRLRKRTADRGARAPVPAGGGDGHELLGREWEYSQSVCETNAACEEVAERVSFAKASAAALPFEDGCFSAVVSNLCFHEVRGTHDKRDLVREALRVLEPGGAFAFQDLFHLKSAYGGIDELLAAVRGSGVRQVEFVDTGHSRSSPGRYGCPSWSGAWACSTGASERAQVSGRE